MRTTTTFRHILSLALCALCFTLHAQTDLKIKLIFSNVSKYPADWDRDGAKGSLIVTNTSKDTKSVKVSTKLIKDGSLFGATDVNKMEVKSIPPGTTVLPVEDVYTTSAAVYYGTENVNAMVQRGAIPDGTYQICTRLVDPQSHADLSAEQCVMFNIMSISPPTLITPANKSTLTPAQLRSLKFTFAPCTPKPATPVIYTLNVYEILPGEESSQARLHTPLIHEVVKTGYSIAWPPSVPAPESGKRYLWEVTDEDNSGNKVSQEGRSEAFEFFTAPASCGTVVPSLRVVCNGRDSLTGLPKYLCTLTLQNNPTSGSSGCDVKYSTLSVSSGGGSITNITPSLPVTIPAGSSSTITFTYKPSGPTTSITFQANGNWNDALQNSANLRASKDTLPVCNTTCCSDMIKTVTQTTVTNGVPYVTATLKAGNKPIKKVQMELVYVHAVTAEGCPLCKNRYELWGNIFGLGPIQLDGFGGSVGGLNDRMGHELTWVKAAGVDMYNTPRTVSFPILLMVSPDQPFTACCHTDYEYCIRYSFTDTSCVTCDTLICSKITFGGGPVTGGTKVPKSKNDQKKEIEAVRNRFPGMISDDK